LAAARNRATQVPLRICEAAAEGSRTMGGLSRPAGSHLGSDLKAGQAMLRACFEAARAMVEINLKG